MAKDTLILKDKTAIELEVGASLGELQVISADKADMVEIWDKLTEENLKTAQIKNVGGMAVGNYKDLVLVSETSVIQPDGHIFTTYSIRKKTEEEKRLDALETSQKELAEGQQTQDGAIADLGDVTSVLAEQAERSLQ